MFSAKSVGGGSLSDIVKQLLGVTGVDFLSFANVDNVNFGFTVASGAQKSARRHSLRTLVSLQATLARRRSRARCARCRRRSKLV